MVTILAIAFFALGTAAIPAPAAAVSSPSPQATSASTPIDTAVGSATTPYEAPRPSGAPGFAAGDTKGSTIIGGEAWATGGDLGGAIAGTALYGSEHQGAGHATGKWGDVSGVLVGTINDGSFAKGCAGGGVDSAGFTQCLQLPPRVAKATAAPVQGV